MEKRYMVYLSGGGKFEISLVVYRVILKLWSDVYGKSTRHMIQINDNDDTPGYSIDLLAIEAIVMLV